MGRIGNGCFIAGPQYEIQTYDYVTMVGKLDNDIHKIAKNTEIQMLKQAGVKFSEKDVIFAARDNTGKLVWLEKGNDSGGLKHIMMHHAANYRDVYGVHGKDIPGFIKNLFISGKLIGQKTVIRKGRPAFKRTYKYRGKYFTVSGLGTNGYIVSVYPTDK
jgi:hypothetical protein